jgi:hypothetical protein
MGNNWGPHVYVWTTEHRWLFMWDRENEFYSKHGFYRREHLTCCGCGKVARSRNTKEFAKLLARVGWYQANYGS